MKISFLHHSGFLLESTSCNVVCDVLQDGPDLEYLPSLDRAQSFATLFPELELPHLEPWPVQAGVLARCLCEGFEQGKPCYFLVSHFHQDHFPHWLVEMYSKVKAACLAAGKANFMRLILSRDVYKHRKHWVRDFLEDIVWLKPGECFADANLKVQAYGSTDVGGSFGFQLENYELFHAGDLNNWHWQEQSSAQESAQAEQEFLAILKSIKAQQATFDVAMFPGDSRMGQDYLKGAQQFLDYFAPCLLAPMHAGGPRSLLLHDWQELNARQGQNYLVLGDNAAQAAPVAQATMASQTQRSLTQSPDQAHVQPAQVQSAQIQADGASFQTQVSAVSSNKALHSVILQRSRPIIWCPVAEGSYLYLSKA